MKICVVGAEPSEASSPRIWLALEDVEVYAYDVSQEHVDAIQ